MVNQHSSPRLESNRLAIAAATVGGIAYAVCAAAVAIAPAATLQLFGWLVHVLNIEQYAGVMGITPDAFLAGLVQTIVYVYLAVLLFGVTYNAIGRVTERRAATRSRPAA